MPDFMVILVMAILCFIVLMIIFGGGYVYFPQRTDTLPSDRTIQLGNNFTVSYVEDKEKVVTLDGEVSNGIFSKKDQSIGFQASDPSDASKGLIELKIWNTNHYGNLIILVNGKEVYRGFPEKGEKTISFDGKIIRENNVLEVKAENSGWRIWAPTIYIFDSDVFVEYFGKRKGRFTFRLDDIEFSNIRRARLLVFFDRKGTGNLDVRLNGNLIHSGTTNIYKDFPSSLLKVGNNTIEFSAEPQTKYEISSAQIVLFFR